MLLRSDVAGAVYRPAAAAPVRSLAWEPPYATVVAVKITNIFKLNLI